ncbi:MAG: hypothetical protein OEY01_10885 [Desulfobulbaceae bacterium]|nr:hypothetical protein [Desulfobulbaceae bacterium]
MSGLIEIDQIKPLSKTESSRLAKLEKVVEENFAAFVVVGLALREINDGRLYRASHQTFAEYVGALWELSRPRAYQLIEAATVAENLSTNGRQTPKNERQARALVGLEPTLQLELWEQAVETAPDGKVTASHINNTVNQGKKKKITTRVRQTQLNLGFKTKISPDFSEAFNSLLSQIQVEIDSDWATTDKAEVIRHLEALLAAIEA